MKVQSFQAFQASTLHSATTQVITILVECSHYGLNVIRSYTHRHSNYVSGQMRLHLV